MVTNPVPLTEYHYYYLYHYLLFIATAWFKKAAKLILSLIAVNVYIYICTYQANHCLHLALTNLKIKRKYYTCDDNYVIPLKVISHPCHCFVGFHSQLPLLLAHF